MRFLSVVLGLGLLVGCATERTEVSQTSTAPAILEQQIEPPLAGSPTALVLDLEGLGVDNAPVYTAFVRQGLLTSRRVFVVVKHEQESLLRACTEPVCIERIQTDLAAARYLVSGSVGKIGSGYLVQLKLIDAAHSNVVLRVQKQGGGSIEGLVFEAARELGAAIPQAPAAG